MSYTEEDTGVQRSQRMVVLSPALSFSQSRNWAGLSSAQTVQKLKCLLLSQVRNLKATKGKHCQSREPRQSTTFHLSHRGPRCLSGHLSSRDPSNSGRCWLLLLRSSPQNCANSVKCMCDRIYINVVYRVHTHVYENLGV